MARRVPPEHKEFEGARMLVARELARANRTGTDLRLDKTDIRTVLYGMVALQAENATNRRKSEAWRDLMLAGTLSESVDNAAPDAPLHFVRIDFSVKAEAEAAVRMILAFMEITR